MIDLLQILVNSCYQQLVTLNLRSIEGFVLPLYFAKIIHVCILYQMKIKVIFQLLAKINKVLLPSYSKKRLDLKKANKIQMLIIGYRYLVTKKSL